MPTPTKPTPLLRNALTEKCTELRNILRPEPSAAMRMMVPDLVRLRPALVEFFALVEELAERVELRAVSVTVDAQIRGIVDSPAGGAR